VRTTVARAVATLSIGAALLARPCAADEAPRTPNELFTGGLPTFVRGTLGDDDADRRVAVQVELLRGMLFPTASVVDDVSIDLAAGPSAWPARPVLYGGSHVNAVVKALEAALPFRVEPGRITVGDRVFEGDEHRLIAVVPPRAADGKGPGHPAFLLYAGAGSPGVTEINSTPHGRDGVLVVDRFGALARGVWTLDGTIDLGPNADRGGWTELPMPDISGVRKPPTTTRVLAPKGDAAALERTTDGAFGAHAGVLAAMRRLRVGKARPFSIYVYPDRKTKAAWTGRAWDGHADFLSRSLHVIGGDQDAIERLVAHEATHVLTDEWGPVATPLVGEGLAVWVSGFYGGIALSEWPARLPASPPSLDDLLGPAFRRTPEAVSYPLAGLLVETLVERVGLEGVRAHFFPATKETWAAACEAAGTTAVEIEKSWRARLGR
jgi:hypothetical protein